MRSVIAFGFLDVFLVLLTVILFALPVRAAAWSPSAHRIVAELAERQLDPSVRDEVGRLLGRSGHSSLAEVANWADEIRDDGPDSELARRTRRMHFVNFTDSGCGYDPARHCAGGACAIAGIEAYSVVLADRHRSEDERAEALRFLVHFVADVHQPLHAGYRPDRGGNRHQVRIDGKGSNLHKVWDSKVLGSRRLRWQEHARRLARTNATVDVGSPVEWAQQSCRLTRDAGIYPSDRNIDAAYLKRHLPLAEERVRLAAARLAALVSEALR